MTTPLLQSLDPNVGSHSSRTSTAQALETPQPAPEEARPSNHHRLHSISTPLQAIDHIQDNQSHTTAIKTEIVFLRASRSRLAAHLEESTAHIRRLRIQAAAHEAAATVNKALLTHARSVGDRALEQSRCTTLRLQWIIALLVCAIAVYGLLCWWFSPEMAYVRRRRADVLME